MTKPRRKPKKPGPAPLADKRDQYLRLMAQGMSNSAACREVGINRKTGNRWRYGRKIVDRAGNHSAENVRDALLHAFAGLPAGLAHSLTWDQGSEMSRHDEFTRATGIPVYFCEPASPWQRGSNENTNGLLRQYFPKSTDLSIFSVEDLAFVAAELNSRPRRTLGWQTPADLFAKLVATLE